MSLSLKVTAAPSCCHSNRNPSVLLPSFFVFFTLESSLDTSTLTTSTMFFFFVCGCDWCITEAEEHRGSTGFLDGQCVRAAQFHQTGPRLESHYAGRPGHPRPSGPDGLQVSLCLWMWVWVQIINCEQRYSHCDDADRLMPSLCEASVFSSL